MHKLFELIVGCLRRKPVSKPVIIRNIDDLAEFVPEGEERAHPPQDLRPPVHSPMTNGAAKILDSNRGGEILIDQTVDPKPGIIEYLSANISLTDIGWKVSGFQIVKKAIGRPKQQKTGSTVSSAGSEHLEIIALSAVSENRTRN